MLLIFSNSDLRVPSMCFKISKQKKKKNEKRKRKKKTGGHPTVNIGNSFEEALLPKLLFASMTT